MLEISDKQVFSLIKKEEKRQYNGIELIASENYVSEAVLEAMGSTLTNKYSEGLPGKRYYGGNEFIDEIEELAITRAKELFGVEHVNVQPYSGSPANLAVYLATVKPGDSVLGMNLSDGGHLTHGFKVSVTGQWFDSHSYGVKEDGRIDYDEVLRLANMYKPKLLWAGFTAYSRNVDWNQFRRIANVSGSILAVDMSHIAGLVAAKQLESPVAVADIVTTTTHKTLRGPRGAMIMCKKEYAKKIDRAVFPGIQGGPHNNTTAAIAVALKEASSNDFKIYAKQVIKNARALSSELQRFGFSIISGGTDNHMMLLNVIEKGIPGKEAEQILGEVGITVNKNTIPGETRSPLDPSGIRIGTAAVTTRGFVEKQMITIAKCIVDALTGNGNKEGLQQIKEKVRSLTKGFKIPGIK